MRLLAALLALLLAAAPAFAQIPAPIRAAWGFDRSDLPPDPAVRFGVLPNGMRYAILRNRVPQRAVAVRLLIGAGATAGGPGEAHYLEHLAFLGSRGAPEGAEARLIGRERLRLGEDFNAHTGDTDTWYRIDLPRPDRAQVDRILALLRDMAGEMTLTPEAVAAAREALIREARERSGPEDRRERDQIAFYAPDTPIARATLTGTEAEVAAVRPEALRGLYERIYRPELATLIIVGDMDADWLERQIAAHFGGWQSALAEASADAAIVVTGGRVNAARPTAFRLFRTPGGATWVSVAAVTPLDPGGDRGPARDIGFLQSLGADMLANRVLGYRGDDRPFMDAEAEVRDYYRTARIARFAVHAMDRDWRTALHVTERELRHALADGFTQAELDIALQREAERLNAMSAPQTSAELANRMVAMVGAGVVITAPGRPSDSAAYLQRIRLADVNTAFRAAWGAPGRLVHVAHSSAIEGGEAALAEAWAASERCEASPCR